MREKVGAQLSCRHYHGVIEGPGGGKSFRPRLKTYQIEKTIVKNQLLIKRNLAVFIARPVSLLISAINFIPIIPFNNSQQRFLITS